MDDDAPLTALAPPVDDDAPLTTLKTEVKTVAVEDDAPLTALTPPANVAKGKGKGKFKGKRKGSSSSSSSDSDTSSSDSAKPLRKEKPKAKAKVKAKARAVKRRVSMDSAPGEEAMDEEEEQEDQRPTKKTLRSPKEMVVAELLCRWWYVFPDWPPDDKEFYQKELDRLGYRQVRIEEWEWVPEEVDGKKKAYAMSQFRGCYRTQDGTLVDCRPRDTCPCYTTMMQKDMTTLLGLLVKAYEGQLAELQEHEGPQTGTFEIELKAALNRAREKYYQAASKP
jgi:hypothetical protein